MADVAMSNGNEFHFEKMSRMVDADRTEKDTKEDLDRIKV
jgi:hypothetical protein